VVLAPAVSGGSSLAHKIAFAQFTIALCLDRGFNKPFISPPLAAISLIVKSPSPLRALSLSLSLTLAFSLSLSVIQLEKQGVRVLGLRGDEQRKTEGVWATKEQEDKARVHLSLFLF